MSHLAEPVPSLGSSNGTANGTTPPVPLETGHPDAESHPSPDGFGKVYLEQMGQAQPVPFEEPSDTNGSSKWDNFGERVEEAPFEGDLLSTTYSSKSDHLYWPRGGSLSHLASRSVPSVTKFLLTVKNDFGVSMNHAVEYFSTGYMRVVEVSQLF